MFHKNNFNGTSKQHERAFTFITFVHEIIAVLLTHARQHTTIAFGTVRQCALTGGLLQIKLGLISKNMITKAGFKISRHSASRLS